MKANHITQLSIIITTAALGLTHSCVAQKNRAVWFWGSSSSPYGSVAVVGSPAQETETIHFFNAQGIKHVYGSYQSRSLTEPTTLANWNAQLHNAGIESQFLMSENTWIFPAHHASFLKKITERLINFNEGRPAQEQFDGLHLDIEPQALSEWSTLSDSEKRDDLNLLCNTYTLVRTHFITNGLPDFPIYADLPVWFDNLSSIGWTNAAERDAWFAAIATPLTGISLMPFDRNTFSSIDNGVQWERSHITNATLRIGLESHIGTNATWSSTLDLEAMQQTLEANYGIDQAPDIQAYAPWRQALADEDFGYTPLEIIRPSADQQALLHLEGSHPATYALLHSTNLCLWQEINRFQAPVITNITVCTTNHSGFWRACHFTPIE